MAVPAFLSGTQAHIYFIFIFCFLTTAKYHYRFNIERKFHDLQDIDLSNFSLGNEIVFEISDALFGISEKELRIFLVIGFLYTLITLESEITIRSFCGLFIDIVF